MALENLSLMNTQIETYLQQNPWLLTVLLLVLLWKLIWYGFAIYRSIELKQKNWFVVLFVCAFLLNDLGLLPILYLVLNKPQKGTLKSKSSKR